MKNLKKVIGVLLILTTMTGCVKYKNTMTINNDKSMIFEGSYLISDKLLETSDSTTFFSEENKKALEERGVKVSEKKENNYTGIAVSKKYDNIDKISNKNGKEVTISDYFKEDFDDSILFKVEKGFLKNKYTANFKYDSNVGTGDGGDTSTSQALTENDKKLAVTDDLTTTTPNTGEEATTPSTGDDTTTPDDGTTTPTTPTTPDTTEPGDSGFDSDIMGLAGEMEFNYVVNLPEKALTNNATNVSNDGKTLTWSLMQSQISNIEFSFELKNMTNYYILYGGITAAVIIVIIIIISLIKKGKKGKEVVPAQNEPIHADYDPSIAQAVPNPAIVNGNVTPEMQAETVQTSVVSEQPVETTTIAEPIQTQESTTAQTQQQETNDMIANGPIGNNNTEPQAHIIPEVTEEPKVVIPEKQPTFITPETAPEEPIVVEEPIHQEIQIDRPQTIDMNQNQ
ncbi:MAG: hypothetical protein SPI44_02175 [Bacilli bacterium]|nr:hypothetical protein [Bacilli bacterium]